MGLQTLSYYGYIHVDHVRIRRDVEDYFDFNRDGVVDRDDGRIAYAKAMEILKFNLPGGSGFGAGFVGGLRAG